MKLRERVSVRRRAGSADLFPAPLLSPAQADPPGATAPYGAPGAAQDGEPDIAPAPTVFTVPAILTGRTQVPDPVIRLVTPARWVEPALAAALALAGGLAAWGLAVPYEAWFSLLALPIAAVLALTGPDAPGLRLTRGIAILAAASAAAVSAPRMAPVTLMIVIAVSAVYPAVLRPAAARLLTAAAVLALAVPLASQLLAEGSRWSGDAQGFVDAFVVGPLDPATATGRLGLAGGIVVVALLGTVGGLTRRSVTESASLAERRGRAERAANAQLERVVSHDSLTGLPNRIALLREVTRTLARQDRDAQLGLLALELERFAALADALGPEAADAAVLQVARRLRAARPATEVVARIGPHHFGVLIAEDTDAETCAAVARRLCGLLAEPITGNGQEVSLTCSIGVAVSGPALVGAHELLHAAEEAARSARSAGRSRIATSDQAMRAHGASQARLELELRDAVRRDQIELAFTPVLALGRETDADRVVAVEAGARWVREHGEVVPPRRFIPLADELGLGVTLGLQLLDQALTCLADWRHAGYAIDQVWLNLAPSQLADPEFAHMLAARLSARAVPASSLMVEVGPGPALEAEQTVTTLGRLRSLGVAVAVDEFGRAGTSLTALRQLPVTVAKLDGAFAPDLADGDVGPAVGRLCDSLGLRVIACGIETDEQLAGARRLGVDAVQGPIVGSALSAAETAAMLGSPTGSGTPFAPTLHRS